MSRPTRTQAIKSFLLAKTHRDLADLYNINMECQVLVAKDDGEPVVGEYQGRTYKAYQNPATGDQWKDFRIPLNANATPTYTDSPMSFDLGVHADGIGMTGWDWANRQSLWVAMDFDAITGHSDRHSRKLTEQELAHVREVVSDVPWVTLRRSTSGNGLHLYVFLKPVDTLNHTEHAALARAIMMQLSGLCGVDFNAKVDACGGNMWVWHRKMLNTSGLTLLKGGVPLDRVPPHWRDHKKVISGGSKKVVPFFIEEMKKSHPDAEDVFAQITGQRPKTELDDEHVRLLRFIEERSNNSSWWDQDHQMLITHTIFLKEAHEALQLRGPFETVATGKDRGQDHNCYAFPIRGGAWSVRRYSMGIQEAPTWDQDGQGWTRCFYNKDPDLGAACRASGGKEHPAGGYVFDRAEMAAKAAMMLGTDLGIHPSMILRKTRLKQHHKDGRLIAEMDAEEGDRNAKEMDSWIAEKGKWKRIFSTRITTPVENEATGSLDNEIRHVVSEGGKDLGWVAKSDGTWRDEPLAHIKPALTALGYKPNEVNMIVGSSIFKPWKLVCKPFEPEEPGNREWNRFAPQLRYQPILDDVLHYPHWQRVLRHCGRGLDSAIKDNTWARANGIQTGADYLKCWVASIFKEPFEPLPYLFLYSKEQNTGKSIFHEALERLLTRGYQRADHSLTSSGNFNGELEGALLCVVEETDLRKTPGAYNKIKDWVTSRQLPIHVKGRTPYHVPNTTHWVQCANTPQACPVFPGDTRITMIFVDTLDPLEMIPKRRLIELLDKEAPHFMAALTAMELPPSNDRLNVPVVATSEKIQTELSNETLLEMYVRGECFYVTGEAILLSDFYNEFRRWIAESHPGQEHYWTKIKMGRELPPQHPKGRFNGPQMHVGNISWTAFTPGEPVKPKLILKGEYLAPSNA